MQNKRFLLTMAQNLSNYLPTSDKSLRKFLDEVSSFLDAGLRVLEEFFYAIRFDRDGKEILSGESSYSRFKCCMDHNLVANAYKCYLLGYHLSECCAQH